MSASLMTSRRFAPLFWCQAFSAFGDNFLKTALVFLILFRIGGADSEALITLAGATLIFPFFLLSGLGGELADRYDKALVARRLKLGEIAVAALAVAGFEMVRQRVVDFPHTWFYYTQPTNLPLHEYWKYRHAWSIMFPNATPPNGRRK